MKLICSSFLSLLFGGALISSASAQITTDGSTNTTLTPTDNGIRIDEGSRAGGNLFHSFGEFSVPTGSEAFFNNALDIVNIFSRVTGGNISNIDGLIRANGAANLFLINPAGILFGEGASLNIGGSFYGSTADSILFPDGEFSATDLDNPPLLTINGPIGLNLGNNPGEITIIGDGLGTRTTTNNNLIDTEDALRVNSTSTLGLVGGDLNLEGATLKTDGGRIELGSVAGNEQISFTPIDKGFSLGYEGVKNFGDIQLSQTATIDASGLVSGDIQVQGNNITLTEGSTINASTLGNILTQETPGIIQINAIDTITIDGEQSDGTASGATSLVNSGAIGDAGGVTITTDNLNLTNGGQVSASTFGEGNAGSVEITARDTITIDGERSNGIPSGAFSRVSPGAIGDAGGVTITTDNLNLTNGGQVSASTFGEGSAGSVEITARDRIIIDGESLDGFPPSGATSFVNRGAIGDAGGVTITTGSLTLTNGGRVSASTFGLGNAGSVNITATDTITFDGQDSRGFASGATSQVNPGALGDAGGVTITTGSLTLTNGGRVSASTFGLGNAGSVNITATDTITFDGETSFGFASGAFSGVFPGAVGNAGNVNITTGSLSLTNGGEVSASTLGRGDGGLVNITAMDTVTIDGEALFGIPSGVFSGVFPGAVGNAGDVSITTGSLTLTNGGSVSASTSGQSDAGSVNITAMDSVTIDGETSFGFGSGVTSQVNSGAEGNAEGVTITTGSLSLTNGGRVGADTFGQGNTGFVIITAMDTVTIDGETSVGIPSSITSLVNLEAKGNVEGVTITTGSLSLTNGGRVDASIFGQSDAGSVNITAMDTVTIDGKTLLGISSSITSLVNLEAEGNAGDVTIDTGSLSLTNGGRVVLDTFGQGNGGSLEISASDSITIDGESVISSEVNSGALGDAGDVTIDTGSLSLTNGGRIIVETFAEGNAGDITVNARELITISGVTDVSRSGLSADALISSGNGGDVNVFTNRLTIDDGGTIAAGNFDSLGVFAPGTGEPGNINIQANSLSMSNQASIEAATQSEIGEGANINLTISEDIILRNNSLVSARALQNADGGNVTIKASDGFIIAFPNQNNDIIANAQQGNGGRINISTQAIFGLEERRSTPPNQTNDIDASSEFGLQGEITINTPEAEPTKGLIELPESVNDPSEQISQNPCERGRSSKFISTGRGGLPPNPTETLSSHQVWKDVQLPTQLTKNSANTVNHSNTTTERIVEATSWIINEQGIVELVAEESSATHQGSCP